MWKTILGYISSALASETVGNIFEQFNSSSKRSVFRRAIRDLVEDEIKEALMQHGVKAQDANQFNVRNKKRLKQEIRSRFDPVLQSKG